REASSARITLFPKTFDAGPQGLAVPQVARRLAKSANAARGAGGDDVAGRQRDELTQVRHDRGRTEDQVVGIGVLNPFVIDITGQPQAAGVVDLIRSHQQGAKWSR